MGVWDDIKANVSAIGEKAKSAVGMSNSTALDSSKLPPAMGLPAEPSGTTVTGGRRYRKKTSKRLSKKRKTMRRKH